MKYYAAFFFLRSPRAKDAYILYKNEGRVQGLKFPKYINSTRNQKLGIANMKYIRFSIPRKMKIQQYFQHTFEIARGGVLTSTDALNNQNRTFGDDKYLGLKDLILFEFSEDMNTLQMYFVKDKGNCKEEKQEAFSEWCNGESLIYEV